MKSLFLPVHVFFLLIFSLLFAKACMAFEIRDLVEYVDPFIGVRDPGSNTTIGPQLPFGSINPGPIRRRLTGIPPARSGVQPKPCQRHRRRGK